MAIPKIEFDVTTLTLGEAARAEMASGETVQSLLKSPMARLTLALYVHELRNSAEPRSWSDLSSLRLLDASSSMQPLDSTETVEK